MNSTILVLMYPHPNIADEVMDTVKHLQSRGLIEIEDACVVVKDDNGHIKIHQSHNLPLIAAAGGAILGSLIGLVFATPYVGAAVGATAGIMGGTLADIGVDDDFMETLGNDMKPGSSALFLLLHHMTVDKTIPELAKHGGKIVHTSLSRAQEERVKKIFENEAHP